MRREPANYQLGRQKANSISEMTRACEFALWEEISSDFSARALNSEGWGLRHVLCQLPGGSQEGPG